MPQGESARQVKDGSQRHNSLFFFFNDTATTEIYTLSLHDALPIYDLVLALEARDVALDARHGALLTPLAGASNGARRRATRARTCGGAASAWDASWSGCGSCTRDSGAAGQFPSA